MLTVVLGVLITWVGLALAYFFDYPVGFYITTVAFGAYVLVRLGRAAGRQALMFSHEFVRNAFLAGTAIALACGLVGYFVVLRAQVFAGDALSHVAFTGALAAAAAGIDLRIGLFAATIAVAVALGGLGDRAPADDVTIGITFAWILGLGVLFLAVLSTGSEAVTGCLGARTLFGSIFGLGAGDVRLAIARLRRDRRGAGGDRPPVAVRKRRSGGRLLPRCARAGARGGPAGPTRGDHRRGHPGDRRAVAAGPAVGAGRSSAAADRQPLPRTRARQERSPSLSTWVGLTIGYLIPSLPPSSAIIAVVERRLPRRRALHRQLVGPPQTTECNLGGLRLRSVAHEHTESWAEHAQRILSASRHQIRCRPPRGAGAAGQPELRALGDRDRGRFARGRPPVGRASIYRILDELERLHLVQRVQVGQAMSRYEPIRGGAGHHHHLVCDNCGTVIPFTDSGLETAIQRLSRRVPMRVAEHEIVLHGACRDCGG